MSDRLLAETPVAFGALPAPRTEEQAFFMRSFQVIVLVLLFVPDVVSAQTKKDSTIVLKEIVVLDSMQIRSLGEPVRIRTLGSARLRARIGESVADVLAAESFLFVQRAGATGLSTASLRGLGSQHTHIYLDGVRLADPQTGLVDLSVLPLTFLESVTVSHGGAGAVSGQSAIGGTVRLRTLRPTDKATFRVLGSAGAYGNKQGGVAVSGPWKSARALIAANGTAWTGRFPYADPSIFPRGTSRRDGADRSTTSLFGKIETPSRFGEWFLSAWWMDIDRGVPGPSNAPPVLARQQDRSMRLWLGNHISIPSGRLQFVVSGSDNRFTFDHPDSTSDSRSETRTIDFSAAGSRVVARSWWLDFGLGTGFDTTRLRSGIRQSRSLLFLTATHSGTRVTLIPGITAERWGFGGRVVGRILPRLAARLRTPYGVNLRGSAARVFRMPTFNERYWQPGGNPDLRPEEGWSVDIGMSAEWESGWIQIGMEGSIFRSRLTDRIVWRPGLGGPSVQVWRPVNVGRVEARGLEFSVDLLWPISGDASVLATLIYSRSRVVDRSNPETRSYGKQLRYTPEYNIKAILSAQFGLFGIDFLSTLTDRRYTTSDESLFIPGHHVESIRTRAEFSVAGGRLRLLAVLENATDGDYETIRFYPMPPRHLRFSIVFDH